MKKLVRISCFLATAMTIFAQQTDFPKLTGSYLGQTPPVGDPAAFAAGIVSNGQNASSPAISPDGNEIYWDVDKIWFTQFKNGVWTKPEMVSFCKDDGFLYRVPCFSPDGRKLYFLSTRSGSVSEDKENIWYVERKATGWSAPQPVDSKVNALRIHWNISVSKAGTIYFQGTRLETSDRGGIYCAVMKNGAYSEPTIMGPEINAPGAMTTCPFIAPDDSYLVFNSLGENPENSGIFISFRDNSGKWLPAKMLAGGSRGKGGLSPRISPDGKYLFFVNGNVYWMPIEKTIEGLRPKK